MQKIARDLWIFITLYAVSRFFCLLIPGQYFDLYEDATWGNGLFTPESIYNAINAISQGNAVLKYPPLYYSHLSLMTLLFGFNSWGIRLAFTCWEIGILIILFRLAKVFYANRKSPENNLTHKSVTVLYLYAFSPITILNLVYVQPWFLGVFYLLLGVYAFYLNKPKVAGLVFCLGFLTQLYPAFCLFPILAYYVGRKHWKELWQFFGVFIVSFIILCFPFFLYDIDLFLFNFLTHFSRLPQTVTLWNYFIEFGLAPFPLFGNFEISLLGILSLSFTFIFFICSVQIYAHRRESKDLVLWMIVLYYIFLPLIFLTLDFRYIYWAFPILCLFFNKKKKSMPNYYMGLTSTIFCVAMGTIFLSIMPDLLTIDQRISYGSTITYQIFLISMLFFLITQPLYGALWLYFGSFLPVNAQEKKWLCLHNEITISIILFLLTVGLSPPSPPNYFIFIIFGVVIVGMLLILRGIFFNLQNSLNRNIAFLPSIDI